MRDDLRANASGCALAFWHAPRLSSGEEHGNAEVVDGLWQALLADDVEVLLSGHEHLYERTAPLDDRGRVDEAHRVRQFVVGTGGGNYHQLGERIPGSEAAVVDTPGVLRLLLRADAHDWESSPHSRAGRRTPVRRRVTERSDRHRPPRPEARPLADCSLSVACSPLSPRAKLRLVTGDTEVLDQKRRDADRVVLCRCGGAGRVEHVALEGPDGTEMYVRSTFTCTWNRPGPHEPLLPPPRR